MTNGLAATLCEPIDDEAPCGPDLDLEYDPEYSLFVARAEGVLPQKSFFDFDRTENDLGKEARTVEALLQRTRDLRLLVLLAKFKILNRDLPGFSEAVAAMAGLLRERWETVHPAADDGDFSLRIVVVESLDDTTSIIMPLQHAPLVTSRRTGPVNFRMIQIAQGEATAREEEPSLDMVAIENAFSDGDLAQVVANRDHLATVQSALGEMDALVSEHNAGALSFGRLSPLLAKMRGFLETVIARRDPSAAAPATGEADAQSGSAAAGGSAPAPMGAGALDSPAAQRRALLSAELYFRENEPSSPALLLVAQARQLVGKGLAESVQLLVPEHASDATINVGGRMVFDLPIERLATLIEADQDGDGDEDEAPPVPANRRDALDILQQVANHLRVREPSSAIPLLCERARSLAERDFMSLLREMLPERAFRNLDDG